MHLILDTLMQDPAATAPPPRAASPSIVAAESSFRVAALLTLAGGFLDAFTYVGHGHVFANAMSGNVVLMGVAAAGGAWGQALHHVPPLLAYLTGVFIAQGFQLAAVRRRLPYPALTCLGLEGALLGVGACLPRAFPDGLLVPAISLVAAMQNSSFTRLGSWSYNSVMTTGNLRRSAEALFRGMIPHRDPAARREAGLFAGICLCFLAGVVAGTFATTRLGNAALWVPAALLAAAFVLCFRGEPGSANPRR